MVDPASNCFFFDAPSGALGDWSGYSGGCLEFSLKSNVRDWTQDNAVALIGANGVSLIAPMRALSLIPISEPTSPLSKSYAVFRLKKKNNGCNL